VRPGMREDRQVRRPVAPVDGGERAPQGIGGGRGSLGPEQRAPEDLEPAPATDRFRDPEMIVEPLEELEVLDGIDQKQHAAELGVDGLELRHGPRGEYRKLHRHRCVALRRRGLDWHGAPERRPIVARHGR
jgi:hypothetical protein